MEKGAPELIHYLHLDEEVSSLLFDSTLNEFNGTLQTLNRSELSHPSDHAACTNANFITNLVGRIRAEDV
jgi:hypothetical protein